jgi:hypothetical protein
MLFHCLERVDPDRYTLQLSSLLDGEVDALALRAAWRILVDRHSIFRTAFLWEGLEEPVQVVLARAELPFEEIDLRPLAAEERERWIDAWLEADRAAGFDFRSAPAMRLALFRLEEGSQQLVWTYHHLVMDGWSERVVLDELQRLYPACVAGVDPELEPAPQFSLYLDWLRRQDLAEAEAFWRGALRGAGRPTPLEGPGDGLRVGVEPGIEVRHLLWSSDETDALRRAAQGSRLTLNTLIQGAWGLLLGRIAGGRDVVFGATVSGRPADLPGVEAIVGPFLNALPIRLRWRPEMRLLDWLQEIQGELAELRRFEHTPLVALQGWSEVPRGEPLFGSLVGFQNRPLLPAGDGAQGFAGLAVRSRGFRGGRNNFPLGLEVDPGARLGLMLVFDRSRFRPEGIELRLRSLTVLLDAFRGRPEAALGALEAELDVLWRRRSEDDDLEREQRNVASLRFAKRRASS